MKDHELAAVMPQMSEMAFAALRDDIEAHGLHMPITTFEGAILDGRHRYRACVDVSVEPRFVSFDGDEEAAAAFVWSTNAMRRDLSPGQRALAAAKMKEWFAVKAKERMLAGVKPCVDPSANLHQGKAAIHAAAQAGVSERSVFNADKVMKTADPCVVKKLESGALNLHEAMQLSSLPPATQRKIVAMPEKAARHEAIRKSKITSAGARNRYASADKTMVQAADAPGTRLIRRVLSQMEILTNDIRRLGADPQKFAAQFVSEFDWSDPDLLRRLAYVAPAIQAVSALSIISQRAQREAA